ncbi:MAG TPA: hypothetical protein DCM86_12065 [Verrucomicrobiales bacterium]|nr:hypothetical protein [Verrucomicrobiales bacterium]
MAPKDASGSSFWFRHASPQFRRLALAFALLLGFLPGLLQGGALPIFCAVCRKPIQGSIYYMTDPVRNVNKDLCDRCIRSRDRCSICTVPVNQETVLRLEDGRLICEEDAKDVVLVETEAQDIFDDVKRGVHQHLAPWPPLPNTNIRTHLVNRKDFVSEYQRKPGIDNPEALLGLTRSTRPDGTNYTHHIWLLSGIPREEFRAVCAHEYTHTWLNEHATPSRTLNKDSVEGFCELMAWKYTLAGGSEREKRRIRENSYTRGQIDAYIAAEEAYQFHRVISWVLDGADSWIDVGKLDRVLLIKGSPTAVDSSPSAASAAPLWTQEATPTPVPASLTLKGISVSGAKRFVLINDRTLEQGEEAKVRLGTSNVLVKCLQIRESSVLLGVGAAASPLELRMTNSPPR